MGFAKQQMLEREGHIEWAKGLLLASESFRECPVHGDVLDNLAGDEAFEEAVSAALANPPPGYTPDEVRQLMQDAVDDTGDECPWCASNARDD